MKCYLPILLIFSICLIGSFGSIVSVCSKASAKDFGVEGHVFPIIEENILEIIQKRLEKIDLKKLNAELKEKTQKYVERPTSVAGITKAKSEENKIFYFDPSYMVAEDIYDHNHLLLHLAGKIINPLDHISLTESLIFIDGEDEEQAKIALNIRKQKQGKVKIILVKGSPLKLQRKHKVWIYFDQAGFITNKLGIAEVPAVVEQEGLRLRITVIGGKHE